MLAISEEVDMESLFDAESEIGLPNQDGQIAAGTLIAGTGVHQKTKHLSQYQQTHYQANEARSSRKSPEATTQLSELKKKEMQKSGTFHVGKKKGRTPLSDEEKKERKRKADKKHREKLKDTKKELQSKIKCLESLLEEKNTMVQKLQDAAAENGRLEDNVRKMEEELLGLKTKFYQFESMNASLMAERETMTKNLQIGAINTEGLQLQICSMNARLQQLENIFLNGQNQEILHMEQGQLGQEENGRLGLPGCVLDGLPPCLSAPDPFLFS